MTQESSLGHGTGGAAHGTAGAAAPFRPQEIDTLHALDREAGRNIVGLLGGLFIVGLILYTLVYLWVRGN
jgi:hypothetical protein